MMHRDEGALSTLLRETSAEAVRTVPVPMTATVMATRPPRPTRRTAAGIRQARNQLKFSEMAVKSAGETPQKVLGMMGCAAHL